MSDTRIAPYRLFRSEVLRAYELDWQGRRALALGLPAAFTSVSSVVLAAAAVALITLNRPQRMNAMNAAMLRELHRAMDAAEADDGVRAIVLSGAGSGFCSGFDLKEQAEARPSGVAAWRPLPRVA